MPFKIRTKLIVAFLAIIFPFITIVGAIVLYHANTIHKASLRADEISEEIHAIMSLQLAIDRALMPSNDYIITGNKKYIDEFNVASRGLDDLIDNMEEKVITLNDKKAHGMLEKMELLKNVKAEWRNIKEISQKIFAIPNPIGDKEATKLMEEMDYKWADSVIEMLDKHHQIDRKEHAEAVEELQRGWRMAWISMIGGGVILITFGVFFAFFYSRLFTAPIEAIQKRADAIAKGDFKTRIDIASKDELGELSIAMNSMATQLDSFYSNLEGMINEKTISLAESEERFRAISEYANDAIITTDSKGNIRFWNKKAEDMFGYASDEVIGNDVHKLIAPERDYEKAKEGMKLFSQTGSGPVVGKTIELSALRKEGVEFPIELTVSAMKIAGEWYSTGNARDITERKQAEKVIGLAKKEYEATFDAISEPIFIHDRECKIIRANRAYQQMAGIKFKEFIGRPYFEVFPKMGKPFKMCLMSQELHEEESEEEFSCLVTNRTFKIKFYPINDLNGKYLYSVHVMEDITEARRAAEALKSANEYARNIIESSLDMIISVGNDRKITLFNKAAQETFGYGAQEVIGEHVNMLYAEPDEGVKVHDTTIKNGRHVQEITNRRKNGEVFPTLLSASALYDPQGNIFGVMGVSRDITEQKFSEEKLKDEVEITSSLLMISETTTNTADIDRLMEQVVRCSQKVMGCDICLSYLWDRETNVFIPSQACGLPQGMVPVFRTEKLDKKAGSSKLLEWLPGISTIATMPLKSKKEYLGLVIGVYRREDSKPGHVFTERDKKIMDGITHQVSVALEEARLYKESIDRTMELSHKIETIQVMHEIDRSILSTLEPQEILETVVRMVSRVIPSDRVTVALIDKKIGGFIYAAGFGTDALPKGGFVPFEETDTTEIIETGRPQYMADMTLAGKHLRLEKLLMDEGFRSHIKVPLSVKGEIVGVLTTGSKRPSAFSTDDLATLEKLAYQVGVALSNASLISDLEELLLGTVKSLSSAIDAKSPWTAGHSERVTKYALDIAKEMGLGRDEMRSLELAGLLHDIGKIGTYDFLLDKPGKLEPDEMEIVRLHSVKGASILEPIKKFRYIIPAIRHHHEYFDGTGYPDKLKGDDIPLFARILAVADSFDAMKADRPYRPGRTMEFILKEFKKCSGTQFDPKVVEAFLRQSEKEKS